MLRWFSNSVTILWARTKMLVGAVLGTVVYYADYLSIPAVKEQVMPYLTAKYVPFYLVGIGIITEVARRRTLQK
jgi:hypothetical protein